MSKQNFVVLAVTFAVCFALWLMFGVTGIPIRHEFGLNGLEFWFAHRDPDADLRLFSLPLGIWSDRSGGRIVIFLMLTLYAGPLSLSS
jgi:MFS transporter, NNP family, nitrate/nitrite transporter